MSTTSELWHKKDPLWLLHASRYAASNQDQRFLDLGLANKYISQFAYGMLPSIEDEHFQEEIHSRHNKLFKLLASEAKEYSDVFYQYGPLEHDDYTAELIRQYNYTYPERVVDIPYYEFVNKHYLFGNLVVAIAIGAIRDMALAEDLLRDGKLTQAEHDFALEQINERMNHVGINGIDKLFEAKPELEQFIASDIRPLDVSHIAWQRKGGTNTRAACYNVEKMEIEKFNALPEALTRIRQQIVSPAFVTLEADKEHYLTLHVHDVAQPSEAVRNRYRGYGIANGNATATDNIKHAQLFEQMKRSNDRKGFEEYLNFIAHDGLAINHPHRNTYAAKIRQQMQEDKQPKVKVVNPGEKIDAVDATSTDENTTTALILASEPKPVSQQMNTANIEDAEIIEETQNPVDPEKKNEVVEAEIIDESGHSIADASEKAKSPANAVTKIATLAGVATLAGLALSGTASRKKEDSRDHSSVSRTNKRNPLKPIAFATATVVTVGGAIMWSKKPEFLHKPLKELIEKIRYRIART